MTEEKNDRESEKSRDGLSKICQQSQSKQRDHTTCLSNFGNVHLIVWYCMSMYVLHHNTTCRSLTHSKWDDTVAPLASPTYTVLKSETLSSWRKHDQCGKEDCTGMQCACTSMCGCVHCSALIPSTNNTILSTPHGNYRSPQESKVSGSLAR